MKNGMRLGMSSALAAAALVVAGPAAAQEISATATISGFSFVLYDLDPSDGIAPELTFNYETSQSYAQFNEGVSAAYFSDVQPGNFVATSADTWWPSGQAHAATGSSSAMAMGEVYSQPGLQQRFSASAFGINSSFTLTPWTGLKLTATFEGSASTKESSGNDYASAQGRLGMYIYDENGYEYHDAYRQAYASCGTWNGLACSGQSSSFSGTFSVSFANFSDDAAQGTMYVQADSYGQSTVPVPEPQTYAMLLAGLVGIGAVVRRRRAA